MLARVMIGDSTHHVYTEVVVSKVIVRIFHFSALPITTFYFLSVREQAEFYKACNLIGSGSGRRFSILPANLGGFVTILLQDLSLVFLRKK